MREQARTLFESSRGTQGGTQKCSAQRFPLRNAEDRPKTLHAAILASSRDLGLWLSQNDLNDLLTAVGFSREGMSCATKRAKAGQGKLLSYIRILFNCAWHSYLNWHPSRRPEDQAI